MCGLSCVRVCRYREFVCSYCLHPEYSASATKGKGRVEFLRLVTSIFTKDFMPSIRALASVARTSGDGAVMMDVEPDGVAAGDGGAGGEFPAADHVSCAAADATARDGHAAAGSGDESRVDDAAALSRAGTSEDAPPNSPAPAMEGDAALSVRRVFCGL